MTNTAKLKGLLVENEMTQEDMAKELNIALFTFNEKLNNKRDFTAKELQGIKARLNMSNEKFMSIFFPD